MNDTSRREEDCLFSFRWEGRGVVEGGIKGGLESRLLFEREDWCLLVEKRSSFSKV